ncbi:rod shape-determining protein MreD [Lactobacillus hominis]|uniref:Rod shape-determining protein MreD n=1 Tax=Lactobacillus hominis DSM 23910 = CRBIP 24.179 TaxID=1423758 RepID=I7L8S3_9LACO|nr:rod shape-determining protein MreD [Lactobacillus hominis]KRM86147.1 rod shape-determining protein MreD [Lactobacillus hominis DSM 23910 = CRBIP 24.179]MCT3348630.1 rod shape-determining protein MreD [Lactobacillus hominis]CCI80894.1 Rod shape-determining protein MreD [Lactobacillus hominis DSM 23910 = CRBIP 24.179]
MNILRRWYVAIALFAALILDGICSFRLQSILFHGFGGAACWFTVVGIVLIGLCDDQNIDNVWLSLGIGLIADVFYMGFIGVYTVIFPAICFLSEKVARFLPEIFISRLIVSLLAYLLVDIYVFLVCNAVGVISVSTLDLVKSFLPSLIMCLIIFLITYAFWVWLVEKYPFLDKRTPY